MFGIFAYAEEDDTRLYPTGKGQYMEDSDSSGTPGRLLPGQRLIISTITVTGVKEPIHGVTPDNNFTVAEKGLTQKPNASCWLDVEAGRWMTSADTFKVDKMYEFRAFWGSSQHLALPLLRISVTEKFRRQCFMPPLH